MNIAPPGHNALWVLCPVDHFAPWILCFLNTLHHAVGLQGGGMRVVVACEGASNLYPCVCCIALLTVVVGEFESCLSGGFYQISTQCNNPRAVCQWCSRGIAPQP